MRPEEPVPRASGHHRRHIEGPFSGFSVLLLLAGCDATGPQPGTQTGTAVACAVSGASHYQLVCRLSRRENSRGGVIRIDHPDGGFRLLREDSGGVFTVADGAEPARIAAGPGNMVDLEIGADRYLLPTSQAVIR